LTIAPIGAVDYISAQIRDPDKAAAMRRNQNPIPTKPVRPAAGSQIPTRQELAIGERHGPFNSNQQTIPIMNSELTNTITDNGDRGAGRIGPNMGWPSFTVPAGDINSPLWTSSFGLSAYLPSVAAGYSFPWAEGAFLGTANLYRIAPHTNLEPPTGFWSDLGGTGSPGFSRGTAGPGGYREPFVTEMSYYNNIGVNIKQQSYSFSYGYDHTNDFILMRYALTNTGNVDADSWSRGPSDGVYDATGTAMRNLTIALMYDFDIQTTLNPANNGITIFAGTDDKAPSGFFLPTMPKAVPDDLPGSGRHNLAPFGPRVYSGLSSTAEGDNISIPGGDTYVWNKAPNNIFNPLHVGGASLLVVEGAGTGPLGDLDAAIKTNVWGGPSVGLFAAHQWWVGQEENGLANWYRSIISPYLTSYPGDPPVSGGPDQSQNMNPNPDFFVSGAAFDMNTDVSTWVPKPEVAALTAAYGDPRRPGTFSGGTSPPFTNPTGKYNNITLYDLDGPFQPIAPDPYKGGDRKENTSIANEIKTMLAWGPFDLDVGESLTVWQVDLVGAGMDGIYDVNLRAQEVWMQRKYNPANDTYYWDGSNDRIIPTYDTNGAVTGTQTVNPGRGPTSGAVFFPPPAPTLSVIATHRGTVAIAWEDNAENAVDPGLGVIDFARYRVYRASGFVDQLPEAVTAHPSGYSTAAIPASMGLGAGTDITDVSDPLNPALKASHPYARFIHEGSVISADYNIGGIYHFINKDNFDTFTAPAFSGPYVQVAEFLPDGSSNLPNIFDPPARITVPNPLKVAERFPGYTEDFVSTIPSSRRIVDSNNQLGSTEAMAITFPATVFDGELDGALNGIQVDPRLAGKTGYLFEDRTTNIGFDHWYYVASVDNESAVHHDFDNFIQDPIGSTQTVIERPIQGLESFFTMNANGTDGLWHGQFPFRGHTVGPEVPGQSIVPTTAVRNGVTAQVPEFFSLVTVAPNPFVFQADWDKGGVAQQTVKFFNLPVPCTVRIFDVAGLPIQEFDVPSRETQTLGGVTNWDLLSRNNVTVAAGLYIILIEAELGGRNYTKTLKLYVRR
jgi:hypothetical protein